MVLGKMTNFGFRVPGSGSKRQKGQKGLKFENPELGTRNPEPYLIKSGDGASQPRYSQVTPLLHIPGLHEVF